MIFCINKHFLILVAGYPVKLYKKDDYCVSYFEFETLLGCNDSSRISSALNLPHTTSSCHIHHPLLQDFVNLESIPRVQIDSSWSLKPCDHSNSLQNSKCGGNICLNESVSFGNVFSSYYDYNADRLIVVYKGGDICGDESRHRRRSGEIRFQCNQDLLKEESPSLIYNNDCHVIWEWNTKVVCNSSRNDTQYKKIVDQASIRKLLLYIFDKSQRYSFPYYFLIILTMCTFYAQFIGVVFWFFFFFWFFFLLLFLIFCDFPNIGKNKKLFIKVSMESLKNFLMREQQVYQIIFFYIGKNNNTVHIKN